MGSNVSGAVITGRIIHCVQPYTLEVIRNGFIIIGDNGKIAAIGDSSLLEETQKRLNLKRSKHVVLSKTQLLIPGFVDCHIHAPQYPNAGLGYDKTLLDWLHTYTFKLEKEYNDLEFSERVFNAVVRKTLDCGTTTACYFASLYESSSMVLVNAVIAHGQRALVGKINMTQNAPEDYVESMQESIATTLSFIEKVRAKSNPLVKAVITPRFALSVDMPLMIELGKMAHEQGLHVQTHISENRGEVAMVKQMYKADYANVYHQANLLTSKTVLAHGVYLNDAEIDLIKRCGSSIAHCPESNCCLASGICDVAKLKKLDVTVGLGTDVSGGPSPSIISAMKAAITSSINLSFSKDDTYKALNYVDAFYLATMGGAKALALDKEIGNFQVGKCFDALIIDMSVTDELFDDYSPEEILQKFVFVGDDRNVIKVFVDGRDVKHGKK